MLINKLYDTPFFETSRTETYNIITIIFGNFNLIHSEILVPFLIWKAFDILFIKSDYKRI